MAYVHSRYEVEMQEVSVGNPSLGGTAGPSQLAAVGIELLVTTVVAAWGPGFVPHILRGAAMILSGSNVGVFTNDAVECRFYGDLSVPGTATYMFSIEIPSSVTGHSNKAIYYKPTYIIEIPPGARMALNVASAATAGVRARCMLYVEPRWEEPVNITTMVKTT